MTFKDVLNDMLFFETIFLTRTANISFNYTKLRGQKNNREKFRDSVNMNSKALMEIDPTKSCICFKYTIRKGIFMLKF